MPANAPIETTTSKHLPKPRTKNDSLNNSPGKINLLFNPRHHAAIKHYYYGFCKT